MYGIKLLKSLLQQIYASIKYNLMITLTYYKFTINLQPTQLFVNLY